ncbi:MAG TPA: hypothetical protein VGL38_09660 [bacterium]|jgi:hypothetical protein
MTLVRPRLTDCFKIPITQDEADFAIPFLDEDIPLCVDPFLLYKSPSQQENALHSLIVNSFNHLGHTFSTDSKDKAIDLLINCSECDEAGLGNSKTRRGVRIGRDLAIDILSLFKIIPQIKKFGFVHVEEIQLLVDQVSRDRISDITCNLAKSFLVDYTLYQSTKVGLPDQKAKVQVYDDRTLSFKEEEINLPYNPESNQPVILVPKRWLRRLPWINPEEYRIRLPEDIRVSNPARLAILNYSRLNYGAVKNYVEVKERRQADCVNDPLFEPIPVLSAKRKLATIQKIPSGKAGNADKIYEDAICQLMASLLYPHLDFAAEQVRTDSGAQIRDLMFYNNRSYDFLRDMYDTYECRQVVFELKNVAALEREHINQINRYLADQFGRFGVIVTRNPPPKPIVRNIIDLWAGQRKCILVLDDSDIALMCQVFDNKQRLPIEVIKKKHAEFVRACPS